MMSRAGRAAGSSQAGRDSRSAGFARRRSDGATKRRGAEFRRAAGFSLAELLVVVAVVAIVAITTAVALRVILHGARLATAKNAVVAALAEARARAIGGNRPVLVAFRARPEGEGAQHVEAVTARFSGESYVDGATRLVVDRFVPIPEVPPRPLPRGIKVAAPRYVGGEDELWVASSDLPAIREAGESPGVVLAVMFDGDGTVATQNAHTDSNRIFVDFGDPRAERPTQRQGRAEYENLPGGFPDNQGYCDLGPVGGASRQFFCQAEPDDEPYVTMAPLLAVFDEAAARRLYDTSRWSEAGARARDLSAYVTARADAIHFNAYTGAAMR